jgi:hypothetical protein
VYLTILGLQWAWAQFDQWVKMSKAQIDFLIFFFFLPFLLFLIFLSFIFLSLLACFFFFLISFSSSPLLAAAFSHLIYFFSASSLFSSLHLFCFIFLRFSVSTRASLVLHLGIYFFLLLFLNFVSAQQIEEGAGFEGDAGLWLSRAFLVQHRQGSIMVRRGQFMAGCIGVGDDVAVQKLTAAWMHGVRWRRGSEEAAATVAVGTPD